MIYGGCPECRGNANGNNVPRTDVPSYKYDRWTPPDRQTVIIISHSTCVYHDILIASAESYTSDVHRMTVLFSPLTTKRILLKPSRLHFVSFNLLRSFRIIFSCSVIALVCTQTVFDRRQPYGLNILYLISNNH